MKEFFKNKLVKIILDRLDEPSTWIGLIVSVSSYFGYMMTEESASSIANELSNLFLALGAAGVFSTISPDFKFSRANELRKSVSADSKPAVANREENKHKGPGGPNR